VLKVLFALCYEFETAMQKKVTLLKLQDYEIIRLKNCLA
jgi:hypothetical protein